jgi:hypothetical protein
MPVRAPDSARPVDAPGSLKPIESPQKLMVFKGSVAPRGRAATNNKRYSAQSISTKNCRFLQGAPVQTSVKSISFYKVTAARTRSRPHRTANVRKKI